MILKSKKRLHQMFSSINLMDYFRNHNDYKIIKDRKNMLEMFSKMSSDPEKFKKILREFRDED